MSRTTEKVEDSFLWRNKKRKMRSKSIDMKKEERLAKRSRKQEGNYKKKIGKTTLGKFGNSKGWYKWLKYLQKIQSAELDD